MVSRVLILLLMASSAVVPSALTAAPHTPALPVDTVGRQIGIEALTVDAPQAVGTIWEKGLREWSVDSSGRGSDTVDFIGLNWVCDPTEVDPRMNNPETLTAGQVARLQRVAWGALNGDPRYRVDICWSGIELDLETEQTRWVTGT